MPLRFTIAAILFTLVPPSGKAQSAAPPLTDAELKYVVYVERHGVRSPTGKKAQYDQYASAPWPAWPVPPGDLTPHGYKLMEIFGGYDRMALSAEGLLSPAGCADSNAVTVYADSDQRTRETGKALASGLFPGCKAPVLGLDEGTNDALFHPPASRITAADSALAVAAIGGRIGNQPGALADAYRAQLTTLDEVLGKCGAGKATGTSAPQHRRTSIFDVPATLAAGNGDHAAELRGPLSVASTLTENILLEYTEGMDATDVAWGCVDGTMLRSLIGLHTAASEIAQRTSTVAAMQASALMNAIDASIQQAVTGRPAAGAIGRPTDKALFLIGHDTNLSNLAGLLNLSWLADGRRDDTPPGSTLIFELWRSKTTGEYSVRTFFMTQTLEQMRSSAALTLQRPPQRVPVFVPGCSRADFSCPWTTFLHSVNHTQDPPDLSPR